MEKTDIEKTLLSYRCQFCRN